MASSPQKASGQGRGKKRPSKYLPYATKRTKDLELRAGLQGILLTFDGGKERSSCHEAIQLLDRFYEKLGEGKVDMHHEESHGCCNGQWDTSNNSKGPPSEGANTAPTLIRDKTSASSCESENEDKDGTKKEGSLSSKTANIGSLLEEEMAELRDRKQARFASLETGCHGVAFIRMLQEHMGSAKERGPNQVVKAIMEDCIQRRQPLTRYCLRFLPIEVTCYASRDEVVKMSEHYLLQHFPAVDEDKALKFAVIYEARANTSLDRMEIINAVAKLVPKPHSVDLKNPDKTIIVQVVKTICAIGVVSNYKQYAKYNIRQLTSPKQEPEEES